MPNVSAITTVFPLRVPNELIERLDAMATHLGERRNDVGREALERGLAQLEDQHAWPKPSKPRRRPKEAAPPVELADSMLKTFAHWVLESARRHPDRVKGSVPIQDLWPLYKHLAPKGMREPAFRGQLEEAHRVGLVTLSGGALVL